jgi:uncharacterized repeat protein (TIGR01451 family)
VKHLMLILLLSVSSTVFAQPEVSIQSQALIEQESIDAEGATIIVRVPVETVDPGDELIFVITVANNGDESATRLKIDNPIPEGTQYVANSQTGAGDNRLVSWDNEEFLSEAEFIKGELSASDIKYLRWTLDRLNANSSSTLEFRVNIQ